MEGAASRGIVLENGSGFGRILILAIYLVASASSSFGEERTATQKQDRANRLDQMSKALEAVKVDRVRSLGNQQVEGRRMTNRSEMHFRFLTCVSGMTDENRNGMILFPLQISGLSFKTDPSGKGPLRRDSGSDFQEIKVRFNAIFDDHPKVAIDTPPLRHGSDFDATQAIRDEVIARVRWFFPEAVIEGRQKYFEKTLTFENECQEPAVVWLHYRTRIRTTAGFEWNWKPCPPHEGQPLRVVVPARAEIPITTEGNPVKAGGVQIWAESESGEQWLDYRNNVLPLIAPNPDCEGELAYYSELPEKYTYTIRAREGKRQFTERTIELRNESTEKLDVSLGYRTQIDNRLIWRDGKYILQPGEKLAPRDSEGMLIRASQIRVTGKTENRRYEKHAADPLWLVPDTDGHRVYQADRIGKYAYVFASAREGEGTRTARVKAGETNVMDGASVLATVRQGQVLDVVKTQTDWIAVNVTVAGKTRTGWVADTDVELSTTGPSSDPENSRGKKLKVLVDNGEIKVGSTTIAQLPGHRARGVGRTGRLVSDRDQCGRDTSSRLDIRWAE